MGDAVPIVGDYITDVQRQYREKEWLSRAFGRSRPPSTRQGAHQRRVQIAVRIADLDRCVDR